MILESRFYRNAEVFFIYSDIQDIGDGGATRDRQLGQNPHSPERIGQPVLALILGIGV